MNIIFCLFLISQNAFFQMEVPKAVYTIWAITLIVVVVVIVPLAVYLLHRTYRAARNIERYFAEMAQAGSGVAENTSYIQSLQQTIEIAGTILSVAGNIGSHSDTIKSTLASRVSQLTSNGVQK